LLERAAVMHTKIYICAPDAAVRVTPKRRAVSRGEYNSKIIGQMSYN
jgi:hypothetical protein